MVVIRPAIEQAGRLLGGQKRNPQAVYRLSRYCVRVPVEEGNLYYHTLTGALWLLGRDERAEDLPDELVAGWALVPEGFDERKQADDLRNLARLLWTRKKKTRFTVCTTTDCNARCYYCFEIRDRRFPMTDQTALDTAAYIARACGGEKVKLKWFGGEPLYNRRAIEIITSRLRELGIDYSSTMVSNGYLLDEETAAIAARDWKLKSVQITLDGTKEIYRRTKAYLSHDEDPLSKVLDHIETALREGIRVQIRLNMNRENADDLTALADQLAGRFPEKQGLYVYATVLREFVGPVHGFAAEEEEKEKVLALRQRLVDLGLHEAAPLPRELRLYSCLADLDTDEAIMADGRILSCDHISEADTVGHINTAERDAAVLKAWKETIRFDACDTCPLYPGCVNLKKCPWSKDGCGSAERTLKRKELEASVLAAYGEWKKNLGEDSEE